MDTAFDTAGVAALSPTQRKYLAEFVARHTMRTGASKRLAGQCRPFLAEPLRPLSFHPVLKEVCYPIAAARALGSRVWDADANEYVDFCMDFGSSLFGHGPAFLRTALAGQIDLGFALGPQAAVAGEAAALVCELTGMERVAFACSGTEAVMIALRVARAVTAREGIAWFADSYHGQYDATLAIADPWGAGPYAVPLGPGIPARFVERSLVLRYGAEESLEVIRTHREELAAVLVEPLQSRRPDLAPRSFLQELRRLTEQAGIALIFDEMITGFRLAPGGAQAWFGVRADLATYGKAAGSGLPVGMVAGKTQYMDAIDGGTWSSGDSSTPRPLGTFTASTFARHPLSLAAVRATLRRLREEGPALQERLNQRTAQLVAALNRSLKEEETPLRFACFGSCFGPVPPFNESSLLAVRLLHYHLLEQGVYLWGLGGFLSTVHTPEDLAQLCSALRHSVRSLRQVEFL